MVRRTVQLLRVAMPRDTVGRGVADFPKPLSGRDKIRQRIEHGQKRQFAKYPGLVPDAPRQKSPYVAVVQYHVNTETTANRRRYFVPPRGRFFFVHVLPFSVRGFRPNNQTGSTPSTVAILFLHTAENASLKSRDLPTGNNCSPARSP